MKAKHLLAALVLPAIFSACSQDELTTNVEKEIVGTPIGYDLEFTAAFGGPTTRLAPGGIGWEDGDKIGMGWISATGLTATANLFSNHPIYYKAGTKKFKSETMIYEGLYIASFPFQPTQKVTPLVFDLSSQKSEDSYFSGRWNVSDKFITLDEKTAGLGNATALTLVPLTNLMKLNIKLAADASVPEDFKITGVTLVDVGSQLVNKLTLASTESAVATGNSSLATACWTATQGNIAVQVGEENVGTAIDATKGLDVFVQMGAFANADATTLTIHTNYGDAEIATGTKAVSWSSTDLSQTTAAEVADFAAAVKAMQAKASGKEYGKNVVVNVTLDEKTIEVPTIVTNQTDLDKIVTLLEKLGKLEDGNTNTASIEFSKSELLAKDKVVDADGDVILTDLSGLNKLGGAITFTKAAAGLAPTNVYISGELALKAKPTINTAITFTILKDKTLTISKPLNLTSSNITVNAGATLINRAAITTAAAIVTTGASTTPAIPAGLYISEAGAVATNITTFTNNGAIEWRAGTLLAGMTGTLYANVVTATDMKNASDAFAVVTNASKEIIIANDMTIPTQLTKTTLGNIKKMTIQGNVTFGLGLETSFDFTDLAAIDIKSGSFNLTGGNSGTGTDAFYALATVSTGCSLTLAADTELNVAAGTKLNLGAGTVTYKNATITNNGYIVATSASGTGTWVGNAVGENPKLAK